MATSYADWVKKRQEREKAAAKTTNTSTSTTSKNTSNTSASTSSKNVSNTSSTKTESQKPSYADWVAQRTGKSFGSSSTTSIDSQRYYSNPEEYARKWGGYSTASDFEKYSSVGKELHYTDFGSTKVHGGSARKRAYRTIDDYRAAAIALYEHNGGKAESKDTNKYSDQINVYRNMEDDEFQTLSYLIAKDKAEGTNLAKQYVDYMSDTLKNRRGKEIATNLDNINIPVVEYAAKLGHGAMAGAMDAYSGISQYITGENLPTSEYEYANQYISESLSGLAGYGHQAATTIGNMLPSITVGSALGPAAGAAYMGVSVAGNAYAQALDWGYNKKQARTYGTIVGALEGGLQYAIGGLTKLAGLKLDTKIVSKIAAIEKMPLRIAAKIGWEDLKEIGEEELQNFIEPLVRTLVLGEEYDAPTAEELLETAIVTFLSTGVMEGPGVISSDISESVSNKRQYGDIQGDLVTEAAELNNPLAQQYQERLDNGKNLTGHQLAELVESNDTAKIQQAVTERLTELGAKENVPAVAAALTKQAMGKDLSKAEQDLIRRNMYAPRVAQELNPENIRSGEYTSDWAQKIGTRGINVEEYSRLVEAAQIAPETAEATAEAVSPTTANIAQESAQAAETATVADIATVEEGPTVLNTGETAEDVELDETTPVNSVKNGRMVLRLADGRNVAAESITHTSANVARVYDTAQQIAPDAKTANTIVNGFKDSGMSAEAYSRAVNLFHMYGNKGYDVADLLKSGSTAKLSADVRNAAYKAGKIAAGKEVAAKQAAVNKVKSIPKGPGKGGRVMFTEGKEVVGGIREYLKSSGKKLTDLQEAGVLAMEKLSAALGTDFYVFESYMKNGELMYIDPDTGLEKPAPNGQYSANGKLYVDLNSGRGGKGLMLYTVAHELTHHIAKWSPAKFKILANYVVKEYNKRGQSVDELVAAKIKLYESRGMEIDYDTAFEEVVADSMEGILADGNVLQMVTEIKKQDMSLGEKIVEWFKNLGKELKAIVAEYAGRSPDSVEGKMVASMQDVIGQIEKLYAEALVDAADAYRPITVEETQTLTEAGIGFDEDTQSVYSLRYSTAYKDEIQVGKKTFDTEAIAQIVAKGTGRSIKDARKWVKSEMAIANIVLANPEFLDFDVDNRYEAIKKNSDYPQGTVDLSNLCPKREEFTAMFDMLQKKYPNKLFTAQDIADMRKILAKNDITVACGACFVEDRRQLIGEIADTFIGMWKEAVDTGKPLQKTNAAGNKSELLVTKALAKQYGLTSGAKIMAEDTYIPNQYDLTTYEGFKLLEKNHPIIAMAFNRYNNSRGQQSARLIEGRAEYNRQILGWTDAKVRNVNNNGGLRIFSFSDFEVVHLLDLVQVIIDCSARGVKIQGYTKIPAFAKLVRDTGIKLNRSLIPKGDYGFHMENGKVVLDYDNVEGINIDDENFIDESDNPNVGNILIGINPTQIGAAMLDSFVDYIIPFHSNKAKAILKKLGTGEWVNYKESQHEKDIATGTASKHNVNIYTQVINKYHPTNKVEFVEAFLKECKRQGKIPRYAEFLNVDANGDYVYREGYHKLLVDFKMFDKDGNILPQGNITPNLNEGFMKDLLTAEVKKKKDYQFPQEVYDDIEKQFGEKSDGGLEVDKTKNTTRGGSVKYSFRVTQQKIDTYVDDAYARQNTEEYIKYAEVSQRLKNDVQATIDISEYSHTLRDNDIRHIRNSHGENTNEKYPVTKQDIKNIPWIIENYDKVYVKANAKGTPGLVYVKVGADNVVYYVEAITTEYHNEKLLVNKQMIKAGFDEIPNLRGLIAAIEKKEGSSQYLADLQEIRKAYVQDVKENYPMKSIRSSEEYVNSQATDFLEDSKLKSNYTVAEIGEMFDAWNSDAGTAELGKKVFAKLQEIIDGQKKSYWAEPYPIRFRTNEYLQKAHYIAPNGIFVPSRTDGNTYGISYNLDYFRKADDQEKARILLHEAIHAVTVGTIKSVERRIPKYADILSFVPDDTWEADQRAGLELLQVFQQVRVANERNEYGQKDAYEMVAEMANPEFRTMLKKERLWDRVVNAIKRILGIEQRTAYDAVSNALEKIIELKAPKTEASKFSLRDTEYMEAVNSGDMDTAQRMVDEAAKAAGFESPKLKHGTTEFGFTKFDPKFSDDGISIFLTDKDEVAESYSGDTNRRKIADRPTPESILEQIRQFHSGIEQADEETVSGIIEENRDKLRDALSAVENFAATAHESDTLAEAVQHLNAMIAAEDAWTLKEEYSGFESVIESLAADEDSEVMQLVEYLLDDVEISNVVHELSAFVGKPMLFTAKKQYAEYFTSHGYTKGDDTYFSAADVDPSATNGVYELYTRPGKQFSIDAEGSYWDMISGGLIDSDSEHVTTRDVAAYAKKNGYDSVRIENVIDNGAIGGYTGTGDVYIFFDGNDLKSADPVTYDDSGNVIPLSERFNPKNPDVRYSLRDGESVSNRSLLANAFEGVAQNDIEKDKIQEYKSKIDTLNAEEQKLQRLNAEIKELSFAQGARDTARLEKLRDEAQKTANRINTYDRQLLRLEASKPLQSVLEREKAKAYKRAEQKGREALEALRTDMREKSLQKQREITQRYQEQRRTAVAKVRETAEKNDAREKLQKLVLDTAKWISYPTKTDVKCPDVLKAPYAEFLKSIDLSSKRLAAGGDPTKNDLKLTNAMDSLATALDRLMANQDPSQSGEAVVLDAGYLDLPAGFVQRLRDMTENFKRIMKSSDGYVVNNMTAAEVRQVSQLIRTLNHAIKEMSTLYANQRFANVEELGYNSMEYMDGLGEVKNTSDFKNFVTWDNALPYYAFKRFGEAGRAVFEGLMDAQDKLAFLADEIFKFRDRAWKASEAKKWSEDVHTVELPSGGKLKMTTADAMSIYCLSRRPQGRQHLLGGGVRVMGLQKGSNKAQDTRSTLTMEDLSKIISTLTDRQRAVAEAMQEFMSTTCSEWGNEISMKRFLTKEFNEKYYFPIESNDENMPTKDPSAQQSDLFRLLNISATKPIDPRANNELIIRNIFDVFTGHASDMARLNAFGMPLLDYMKWLNYREKTTNDDGQINVRGVRKSMEKAYGTAAKSYVMNLIKDVNGRPSDGGDPTVLMKWMRAAKTASVGSSLRVATLQVTSYPRASLVLSQKSLALGLTKKPNINKAKKYCGIALWKSFGFYDTNISRTLEEQMKGTTDFRQKLIELSLKGAELGDAMTWGALWNACEYEVAATKQYKVGTEEFNKAVGLKLREVVYRTQVVDSTLTRSQIMRSKKGMAQEAAAFMSESTLSGNILMDAGFEYTAEKRRTGNAKKAWKKTGKIVGSAVAVYTVNALTSALLESLWDAWRDDEDEEYVDKFLKALPENVIMNLAPFNKIPILSDVFSAAMSMLGVGFYSTDKMSTIWLTQAVDAVATWQKALDEKSSTTVYNALYKSVRAVSSLAGISFSGAMREVVDLWNNTAGAYDSTLKIRKYEPTKDQLGKELYKAITGGDTRQAESLRNKIREKTADEAEYKSYISSAMRKALRENDSRIWEAAVAWNNNDLNTYMSLARGIVGEGNFTQDDVVLAIRAEANAMIENDDASTESKAKSYFTTEKFAVAVAQGNSSMADIIREDLILTHQKNGKSADEAEKSFNSSAKTELRELFEAGNISERDAESALASYLGMERDDAATTVEKWAFEVEHGYAYSDRAEAYKNGEISAYELRKVLVETGGMTDEEADLQIQVYDWEKEVPGVVDITRDAIKDYNDNCEAYGISKSVYYKAWRTYNDIDADYDQYGKSIKNSKTQKVMPYIDSLPLTAEQKTALAECWWAESTVRKYKLW